MGGGGGEGGGGPHGGVRETLMEIVIWRCESPTQRRQFARTSGPQVRLTSGAGLTKSDAGCVILVDIRTRACMMAAGTHPMQTRWPTSAPAHPPDPQPHSHRKIPHDRRRRILRSFA
jgi:hypothetical protein